MQHEMKINARSFKDIQNGTKTYEIRLYDEKRRKIKVGDNIVFHHADLNESINAKVKGIIEAKTFSELFTKFPPKLAGWPPKSTPQECSIDMLKYYSPENEREFGAVAIQVELHPTSKPHTTSLTSS